MKLLNDLVLIEEIKKTTEKKLASGLIIPTEATEKEYEVKSIGVKCKALKIGDKIRLYEHTSLLPFNDGFLFNEAKGLKVIL